MPTNENISQKRDISLMFPIFGSHVRRIGWIRTIIGGLPMYLSIPVLIMCQLMSSLIFYQWIVRPLFGTRRLEWKNYIIIDRHRIEGLPALDKFNCMFCGYANGLCTLLNKELDQLDEAKTDIGLGKQILLNVVFIFLIPWGIIVELSYQIIYNILVSIPLGMHRTWPKEIAPILESHNYAGQHSSFTCFCIRRAKNTALRFAMALEQIESSWCPLTHFERREGIVYPDHHKHFFGPDEVGLMRQTLLSEGTVSSRRPLW